MIEKQLHGSVYVALGPGMQVYDISTEGIGEAGFRQFIDSIQHASIRKRGVPILTFGRYDMEDMRGLHFTSGQDKTRYLLECLGPAIQHDKGTLVQMTDTVSLYYCCRHDIDPLSDEGQNVRLRQDFRQTEAVFRSQVRKLQTKRRAAEQLREIRKDEPYKRKGLKI